VTTAYFVFSEAHETHGPVDASGVICKVCQDLGLVRPGVRATLPSEPTPIDVPEPPIEPAEPPGSPTPDPELVTLGSGWSSRVI
jgi:hypothetical protein